MTNLQNEVEKLNIQNHPLFKSFKKQLENNLRKLWNEDPFIIANYKFNNGWVQNIKKVIIVLTTEVDFGENVIKHLYTLKSLEDAFACAHLTGETNLEDELLCTLSSNVSDNPYICSLKIYRELNDAYIFIAGHYSGTRNVNYEGALYYLFCLINVFNIEFSAEKGGNVL